MGSTSQKLFQGGSRVKMKGVQPQNVATILKISEEDLGMSLQSHFKNKRGGGLDPPPFSR